MYQSVRDNIETAQEQYESGKTNTDDFISYVNLLSGKYITSGSDAATTWEQLHETIQGTWTKCRCHNRPRRYVRRY